MKRNITYILPMVAIILMSATSLIHLNSQVTGTLPGANGGTGVANTGKTITVSGNTTIGSSTHTFQVNTSGNTNVAIPTSGTLATLSGTETLSDKTFTTPTIGSFINANHNHSGGSGGGMLGIAAISMSTGKMVGRTSASTGVAEEITPSARDFIFTSTALSLKKATQTLTDGSTVTFDVTAGYNAAVTLGGNRTLSITNMADGEYYTLIVKQDVTGSRTLALPASTKVIGGGAGAVTLTTAANGQDILTFFYSGSTLYCNYGKNYN